ncbi:glycine amidinotransferase [Ensifer aridi]|uniref:glycine amidinotransferase n=1 Tax=Ensifer aridi TaxID=1708715 RepID=UPI0003F50987|nr:glycine amidinotransferase [Ensifer aridi]
MKLNSYDEWSHLREVIVGSAVNYTSHERELSFEYFFLDNLKSRREWYYPRVSPVTATDSGSRRKQLSIKQRYVEELNEDVDGIVSTLQSLGVKVHRPLELDPSMTEIETLAWRAAVIPALNVRDMSLVLGDEIVETAPMMRSRYFETQLLTPIFAEYFRKGARWSAMPRPIMTDSSFDPSYAQLTDGGLMESIKNPQPSPYDVGFEIMIDGAQCLRLGRDVLVNVSTENHAMAYTWLQRHFEGRFRFHRIDRLSDSHIDSMILALRPGTLLVRSEQVADYLPAPLKNWELIVAPDPQENNFPTYESDDLILTSLYIDMNVLSVSPEMVIANEASPELIRLLERHKFTVVPVRHRHRRLFGGGFHCFTLDTVRDGGPEDYV